MGYGGPKSNAEAVRSPPQPQTTKSVLFRKRIRRVSASSQMRAVLSRRESRQLAILENQPNGPAHILVKPDMFAINGF
jgi:hypothetical protein